MSKEAAAVAQDARSGTPAAVGLGIAAGVVFAIVEMVAATAAGLPANTPLRLFGSIVLGRAALSVSFEFVAIAGLVVHLVLSAGYGAIYGALNARVSPKRRGRIADQAFAGILYGSAIWLVNYQLVGRIAYPWFLDMPQDIQWLVHALFFGLPLGLMYAALARRMPVG
jgi:hypothetical protein